MSVSNKDLVSSLYIAVYNRAPEASGLNFWTNQLDENLKSFSALSQDFITHPVFQQTYGNLSHRDMVDKFYHNVLGHAGDQEGINYWTASLDQGASVGEVLSSFLDASLNVDLNTLNLSAEERQIAFVRQNTLKNKVEASNFYADQLQGHTELSAGTDLNSLAVQNDPKYQQAQQLISKVDHQWHTVENVKHEIEMMRPADQDRDDMADVDLMAVLSTIDFTPLLNGDYGAMGVTYAEVDHFGHLADSLFFRLDTDPRIEQLASTGWETKSFYFNDYLGDINQLLSAPAMVKMQNYLLDQVSLADYRITEVTNLVIEQGNLHYGLSIQNGLHVDEVINLLGVLDQFDQLALLAG